MVTGERAWGVTEKKVTEGGDRYLEYIKTLEIQYHRGGTLLGGLDVKIRKAPHGQVPIAIQVCVCRLPCFIFEKPYCSIDVYIMEDPERSNKTSKLEVA